MNKYTIICIDMFQTLVDVDTRIEYIWKRILKEDYNDNLKNKYVKLINSKLIDEFHSMESKMSNFRSLRQIFLEKFTYIFQETKVDYCPSLATEVFIEEHSKAELYDDSLEFLNKAREKYIVCLVSDADFDMVEQLIQKIGFDDYFISQELQSYKGNKNSVIFQHVLNKYNVKPDQILHIGDASSDMIGAKLSGIDTCWINRNQREKRFDIIPDYEVESLKELYSVLNI